MLASRSAIVTGAGRGIGAAVSRLLAQHGASVVVNDLDLAAAEATCAAITGAGGVAHPVAGSVMDEGFAERLVGASLAQHGSVDIIVNNAGFLWDGVLHKMEDRQWSAVLECHLTAPFKLARAASAHMREQAKAEIAAGGAPRDRSIVNVSSTSGLHGNVGQANYAAAKAGVVGLTKTQAREWGPLGIRANVVAFGMIETRMTSAFAEDATVEVGGVKVPQGLPAHVAKTWQREEMLGAVVPLARKGSADEAASGVFFLASPLASYVTGHTLEVTGGMGI